MLNIPNRKASVFTFTRMGIVSMGRGIRLSYKEGSFSSVKGGRQGSLFLRGKVENSNLIFLSSSPDICRDCLGYLMSMDKA